MFKNRKLTVTVDKKDKNIPPETLETLAAFEKKSEIILKKLEYVGVRVFFGVCFLIILDTHRQVAIAKANRPEEGTLKIKAL